LFGGLSVQHAITRSVRDSAALLDVTAGPELGDAYWAPPVAGPFLAEVGRSPGKLRIGMTYQILPGAVLHPECRAAVDAAAKLCEALGHEVDDVTDQLRTYFDFDQLMEAVLTIAKVSIAAVQDDAAQLLGRNLQDTDVEPVTWDFMAEGRRFSALDLNRARTIVHRSSRQMAEFQQDYGVILSPTLAEPPIKHGVLSLADPKDYIPRFIRFSAIIDTSIMGARSVSNVTQILSQIESGDPKAAEQLLPLVYDELRKLAAAKLGWRETGPDAAGDGHWSTRRTSAGRPDHAAAMGELSAFLRGSR
jgi:amidase